MARMETVAATVESLGLDATEQGLLAVVRHFLTSFAQPETQAWIMAYGTATERWGHSDGARLAQGVLAVLQAALRAREGQGLRFGDPLCPGCRGKATPDEAALMTMLHHMRRDETGQARIALADLTQGRMDAGLIRAGLSLAALFPAEGPAQSAAMPAAQPVYH